MNHRYDFAEQAALITVRPPAWAGDGQGLFRGNLCATRFNNRSPVSRPGSSCVSRGGGAVESSKPVTGEGSG